MHMIRKLSLVSPEVLIDVVSDGMGLSLKKRKTLDKILLKGHHKRLVIVFICPNNIIFIVL